MTTFRILVVANKTWECEPLVQALLARDARPPSMLELGNPVRGYDPALAAPKKDPVTNEPPVFPEKEKMRAEWPRGPILPRLSFRLAGGDASVEVWCIEDWMRKVRVVDGAVQDKVSSSSSHEKFTFTLPRIRERTFWGQGEDKKSAAPDLVIAFGTAGVPGQELLNGCVTIGSRVYLRDAWTGASPEETERQENLFGPLLRKEIAGYLEHRLDCPRLQSQLFSANLPIDVRHSAEARFLHAPLVPAEPPRILAGHGFAALGTLNICDYDDYVWADEETLLLFEKEIRQREIGSMETTHGLIRLTWPEVPFLFVSGLTDRVPLFNLEVTPRKYAQNFVAAHNAGVTVAHLLPELVRLSNDNLFDMNKPTLQQAARLSDPPQGLSGRNGQSRVG